MKSEKYTINKNAEDTNVFLILPINNILLFQLHTRVAAFFKK